MNKTTSLFIIAILLISNLPVACSQQKDSSAMTSGAYFFRSLQLDSIPASEVPKLIESMSAIEFSNCYILLSGKGFPNVVQLFHNGGLHPHLSKYEFQPGSKITLEKMLIKDKTGKKRAPITKTFIIKEG